jgi:putative nucleotidyltransferase with HDIG domain
VDAKDHYTYGHSKKVSEYAVEIAQALGYSEERIASIRTAALLHDIGKIGISDEILRKHGPLSNDDWEPIHAHPNLGVAILKHIDALSDSLAGVQYHHERHDGTGYPSGLHSDNIPLDARILAVADSYDAMTSERPYKTYKLTPEEGLKELRRCAGTQFDPVVVEAFINISTKSQRNGKKKSQASLLPDPSLTSASSG